MAAQLDFYSYDETTKISTALNGTYSLGDIFKGASGIGTLRIYNSGTKTAVNPIVSFKAYIAHGRVGIIAAHLASAYLFLYLKTALKAAFAANSLKSDFNIFKITPLTFKLV